MQTLLRVLDLAFKTLAQLLDLLIRSLARLARYWANDMRSRTTTTGKVASFAVGLFAILCACSLPLSLLSPNSSSSSARASTGAVAASAVAPTDEVVTETALRDEPSVRALSIGVLCPGDGLTYLAQHQTERNGFFRVRLWSLGPDCDARRAKIGMEGWVNIEHVTPPSDGLAAVPLWAEESAAAATQPTTQAAATVAPTATVPPPPPPTATLVQPPLAQADRVANVRSAPRVADDTVLAKLCPGDTLEYVSVQQVGDELWFRVRVAAAGPDCDSQRAAIGTEGWASASVVVQPSYDVRSYAEQMGFTLPTAIPPTAVPTRAPTARPAPPQPVAPQQRCDPSYPDFCLPVGIGDLNCPDIPYRRFTVIGSDPHGFDRDRDGVGCES
jgi:hypothetical protein